MKLDKNLDLSGVVSKESMKFQLQDPYLTPAGELVATNGHILAVIPGVMAENSKHEPEVVDTEGYVTIEAIKAAKGEQIHANGSLEIPKKGVRFERPKDERRFPDWAKIRDGEAGKVKPIVSLNADYIIALARAIKAKGYGGRAITLWADPKNMSDGAWMVTPHGVDDGKTPNLAEPHGVIMPVRR